MSCNASDSYIAVLLKTSIENGQKLASACVEIGSQLEIVSERVKTLETRIDELNHQLIHNEPVTCSCSKHDVRRKREGEKTLDT